jgi:hypothetical protein
MSTVNILPQEFDQLLSEITASPNETPDVYCREVKQLTQRLPFKKSLQTLINIYTIYKQFHVTNNVLFVKFA